MICECPLMVFLNGWRFMNQSLIYPSGRESLFEKVDRNIFLNIPILILMLTLKSIKMRQTAINSLKTSFKHLHSTHNLETNFTNSIKRKDYAFHPQLTWRKISVHTMQHRTLQSSFSWRNFAMKRMDSHGVRYMIVLLMSTIVSKNFVNIEPGMYFTLEG